MSNVLNEHVRVKLEAMYKAMRPDLSAEDFAETLIAVLTVQNLSDALDMSYGHISRLNKKQPEHVRDLIIETLYEDFASQHASDTADDFVEAETFMFSETNDELIKSLHEAQIRNREDTHKLEEMSKQIRRNYREQLKFYRDLADRAKTRQLEEVQQQAEQEAKAEEAKVDKPKRVIEDPMSGFDRMMLDAQKAEEARKQRELQ
jgi:hypothetical protein